MTIPAGGSVSVVHSLPNYDYTTSGAGKYTFEAHKTRLQTADGKFLDIKVDAVEVEVTEAEETFSTQTTTPTCSNGDEQNLLATMLSEARALAGGAASDINSHPDSSQFAAFLGNNDRGAAVWQFDTIAGDLDGAGTRMFVFTTDDNSLLLTSIPLVCLAQTTATVTPTPVLLHGPTLSGLFPTR